MTQISRPWQSTTPGDAGPYSSDNWSQLQRYAIGQDGQNVESGVIDGSGAAPDNGLTVTQRGAGANMSVDISAGAALVNGTFYINDAVVNQAIAANASGNPRIDTIILNKDWSAQTIRLAVVQGTPAGTPVPPSLVQNAGVQWQIPIADVAVANGAISIVNANLTPRTIPANCPACITLRGVLNNSGVVLQTGDVVILDTTADRAMTTTTTISNKLVLGAVVGRIAIGAYGRVQVAGIGLVNASAAVTRGQALATSSTAKRAMPFTSGLEPTQFAVALQTTAGAGLVLVQFGGLKYINPSIITADPTELSDSNSAAEVTMWTGTIPGNLLGINDSFEFEFWVSWLNNCGAARTYTIKVKFGGTTVLTMAVPLITNSATAGGALVKGYIKNAGATNSQKGVGVAIAGTPASQTVTQASGTAAVDTTANQTLTWTLQADNNAATQTYTEQQAIVRFHKNT